MSASATQGGHINGTITAHFNVHSLITNVGYIYIENIGYFLYFRKYDIFPPWTRHRLQLLCIKSMHCGVSLTAFTEK